MEIFEIDKVIKNRELHSGVEIIWDKKEKRCKLLQECPLLLSVDGNNPGN